MTKSQINRIADEIADIAAALRLNYDDGIFTPEQYGAASGTLRSTANSIATVLAETEKNFDRIDFIRRCGF